MDQPNTLLADVPIDILNLILSDYGISYSVISLWKCGSTKLNYILRHGGCTSVDLRDLKPDSTSRFPKMLFSLQHLRILSISRGKETLAGAYELRQLLWMLPSTIESLKLTCKDAESCFFRHPKPNPYHAVFVPTNNGEVSDTSDSLLKSAVESPLWDVSSKFPKLSSLSLCASYNSMIIPYCRYLPSTVTELAILTFSGKTPPRMPSQLVSLKLSLQKHPEDYSFLPSTLEHFEAGDSYLLEHLDEYSIEKLPKNLKSIDLPFAWSPAAANVIPKGLEFMRLMWVADDTFSALGLDWATQLPKSLTRLHLDEADLTGPDLRALPSTLTELSAAGSLDWSSVERETDFPSSLTHLNSFSGFDTPDDMKKLPRGLIYLTVYFSGKPLVTTGFEMLPPKLETLNYLVLGTTEVELHQIEFPVLPKTLTHLWVTARLLFFGPFTTQTEGDKQTLIPSSVKDRIPPYLRHMDANWFTPLWHELPDTLEALVALVVDPNQLHLLPRTLTSLIAFAERTSKISEHALNGLPPALTALDLLELPFSEDLQEHFLSDLPKFLQKLTISFQNGRRTPYRMLFHLPSKLKFLTANVDILENEIFMRLPRTLQRFQTRGWEVDNTTPEAVPFLPPCLAFGDSDYRLATHVRVLQKKRDKAAPRPIASPDPRVVVPKDPLK